MKVLVIGRGGRCHAIAWKLFNSKYSPEVFVAPGNAGMTFAKCVNIDEMDNEGLVKFALENKIDLTVVGPEAALSNGVVNAFKKSGLRIFGPTKEAAIIEASKEFTKDLMKKYNVPTAKYEAFDNYEDAKKYLDKEGAPIVIKYDGLAAGKGVVVANTYEEAHDAIKTMLLDKKYGNARVVIEECLVGPEFSLMAFVNGTKVFPMMLSQDHKRAYDNDQGPNTGGMGAYSPVPIITDDDINYAMENIMKPVATAMVKEGRPFVGVLYGGLMKTKDGVKVIEFNARFGDPETEVVLPRLDSDLVDVFNDCIDGKDLDLKWSNKKTLGVVMASIGYPESYKKGYEIEGLDQELVFHMGTSLKDGKIVNSGGRVLMVVGVGDTLLEAQKNAYEKVSKIKCENLFYRHDIGYQVVGSDK